MKISFSVVFLFLLTQILSAGEVILQGFAPEYAGYQIQFVREADPVSDEKIELCTITVKPDGSFRSNVQISAVVHATANFDTYVANIYLAPGKTYDIIFPPLKKISEGEKRNPFYQPSPTHLAIKDAPPVEINRMIREFEQSYQQTESRFFEQIYRNNSREAVDSVQNIMHEKFPKTEDPFFEDYKFYRLAFSEFALHQGRAENFIQRYFIEHQPNYSAAPCKNLFDRLFTNYFSQLSNTIDGNDFRVLVAKSNPQAIENYLIQRLKINPDLAQLIILKSVYDAFYQGQFSQKNLLTLLANIEKSNWSVEHKQIGVRLKKKLTFMLPATLAPPLIMTDFNGDNHQLTDFSDKYTYVHFTRIENPICRQHLDELKKLTEAVTQEIHILNLILTEETQYQEQIAKQNWPGQFMVIDEKTAETWKVKSFPTAYLVDKEGKLIYSPAANPLNGFDRQIGTFLQKKHFERIRNQSR